MPMITDEKRTTIASYANEFEKSYLLEPAGQRHLAAYKKEKEEVVRYWQEIKEARRKGQNTTNMILEKLLPYANTSNNRQRGYRISIAPAITKDLQKWFENAGWQQPGNWDNVANAIYDLIHALVEKGEWDSLEKFERNESVSRGIKAGFISPTLHFLDGKFRIINSKTIDTVNFILARKAIDRDLSNYREYLRIVDETSNGLGIVLFRDADVFDAFCHWMCDKRLGGYARREGSETTENLPEVEEAEGPSRIEEEQHVEPPQNHWEAIFYLVKAGNALGFKTYVADPSRTAFEQKLGDIASLTDIPPILKSVPEMPRVDVIWYSPGATPPLFMFEVEDGGTMREALHRLYNAMAFSAKFFIVSPTENRPKFEKWVGTAPFHECRDHYNFQTYSELADFYRAVVRYEELRRRFLKV